MKGNGSGSGLAVGGVEGVIGSVLMVGHTLLSTLGWTGSSDEIAQLLHLLIREFLSLHPSGVGLSHQIGAAE